MYLKISQNRKANAKWRKSLHWAEHIPVSCCHLQYMSMRYLSSYLVWVKFGRPVLYRIRKKASCNTYNSHPTNTHKSTDDNFSNNLHTAQKILYLHTPLLLWLHFSIVARKSFVIQDNIRWSKLLNALLMRHSVPCSLVTMLTDTPQWYSAQYSGLNVQ